jgi:O-antigen biosynthesis protein
VQFEGGLPGHPFRGFTRGFKGYANNTHLAQNLLAVTGACLMTSAAAFERVGGLPTELPVNYNDVEYCLKLGAAGLRIVYDPDTLLYHFESSSRSSEVADWEKEHLLRNWRQATARDPVSHPYLAQQMPRLRAHLGWAVRKPRLRR